MRLSACIEWLYATETEDLVDRIALARQDGLSAIEFWTWSDKNVERIASALRSAQMQVSSIVAEPMIALTDRRNQDSFLKGLLSSVEAAKRIGAPLLIVQAGDDLPGEDREDQRRALIAILAHAGRLIEGSGIRLGLEPLNTLIDHPGYFLSSTEETLKIVLAAGEPNVGIVYDLYHSAVMNEDTRAVIGGNIDRVFHLHIADYPGRNEPGTGTCDLRERLSWLAAHGYSGFLGLEYRTSTRTSATVAECRRLLP